MGTNSRNWFRYWLHWCSIFSCQLHQHLSISSSSRLSPPSILFHPPFYSPLLPLLFPLPCSAFLSDNPAINLWPLVSPPITAAVIRRSIQASSIIYPDMHTHTHTQFCLSDSTECDRFIASTTASALPKHTQRYTHT